MALALIAACLSAACAYLLAGVAFEAGSLPRRPCRPVRLAGRAVSACEALGHTRPVSLLAGVPRVRAFLRGLQGSLARRGAALTLQGCLAALLAACTASCLGCVFVSGSLLGAPVGVAACVFAGTVLAGGHERELGDARAAQIPDVLRSLSNALGAGRSLSQAVEHVGTNLPEPMGTEFLQASFEIRGGCSVEEAVEALCARVDAPGMSLLGTALQISQRTGSPLNDLFARTARMVSDTVALRRELQVKTSQVRLSARVVALMPVLLCGLLVLVSPDYRAGLELQAGRTCLVVAALLDVVALRLVRRTMSGSLA